MRGKRKKKKIETNQCIANPCNINPYNPSKLDMIKLTVSLTPLKMTI